MAGRGSRTVRFLAAATTAVLVTAGLTAGETVPAGAVVADQPVSANASSMWQTNNSVWALDVAGGVVYAGGDFTRVRPPGAAPDTNFTVRSRIAAFSASTGALVTGFDQSTNGRVLDLDVSPDGTKLYMVGAFTSVGGVARDHVARLNLPSGDLDTTWTADANATVATVTAGETSIYVGGDFTVIKGVNRTRLARLNTTNGNVNTSFTASSDKRIAESVLAPDGSRLLVGGENDVVNGQSRPAIASLDPSTGALRAWDATGVVPRVASGGGCDSRVTDIVVDGSVAYVTAEGSRAGCWEGVYSADISDGQLNFNYSCMGGSMALAVAHGWLYRGSHNHDCAKNPGGFTGQTNDIDTWYRLQVHDVNDNGRLGHWSPNTNGGSPGTSTTVGPLAMATDGSQIFVGGDQSQVNGVAQQGLTRFRTSGGNTPPPTPVAPVAVTSGPGKVTITVEGVADANDGVLSYRLYRNGGANPIARLSVESWPWSRPVLRFVDTGRPVGSWITYQVLANDGTNGLRSPLSVPVQVKGTNPKVYQSAIKVAPMAAYWRLHGGGTSQSDSSGNGRKGTVVGSVARAQPGAIVGNNAIVTDGSSGYVRSLTPFTPSVNFTQSVWFKTTTQVGGAIMGFSNQPTGPGTLDNRAIWMDNDGKIGFGIRRGNASNPSRAFVRSSLTYNDGKWHQAVATFDGSQIRLFMDGNEVASLGVTSVVATGPGYLRVGYLDLSRFYAVFGSNFDGVQVPLSYFFQGGIDEAGLHSSALTDAQVRSIWEAGAARLAP